MHNLFRAGLLLLSSQQQAMQSQLAGSSETLRVMTFNIRFDGSPAPAIPERHVQHVQQALPADIWGEKRWSERRFKVADTVTFHDPDVFGFQEVLVNQMEDLSHLLGTEYDHVGVGRDDGRRAGEYVPVFFRKNRFQLLATNHFWLSDSPDKPGSVGWDASQTRMVTIASLLDRAHPSSMERSGAAVIHVANTHYDDRGRHARAQSSLLIRRRLPEVLRKVESAHNIRADANALVVLLGDFNSPEDESGYRNMVSSSPPGMSFRDTRYALPLAPGAGRLWSPYGPTFTYTGFSRTDRPQRIDFIFLGLRGKPTWEVRRYSIIENKFEGGDGAWTGLSSDHRPVLTELVRI